MLGNVMFRVLSESADLNVFGTVRSNNARAYFPNHMHGHMIFGINAENQDSLAEAFATVRPNVVINCVGLVKQSGDADAHLKVIPINTLLPHRLATLCQTTDARLIHISTDCVFSGAKGNYVETDFPDACDLYGRSKLLGEVEHPCVITLRTSIIGHELFGNKSLLSWFLRQQGAVNGFTRAIFSGLPTVELATVIRDIVLPSKELHGLYHVSANPISKFDLLQIVAEIYGKNIEINPSEELVINRSLNSERFKNATGYMPPDWPILIKRMFEFA